jgi:hypothetical protein
VAVNVQQARLLDHLRPQLLRVDDQPWVPMPEHGPFARLLVHQDVGGLVGTLGNHLDVRQVNPFRPQTLQLEIPHRIRAHPAHILGPQPQPLARHQGGRRLSARLPVRRREWNLTVELRKGRYFNGNVGRVQPQSHNMKAHVHVRLGWIAVQSGVHFTRSRPGVKGENEDADFILE